MAINKKLIHFKTKAAFEREKEAGNILDTSICFIKDSQQIYTHGLFYDGKQNLFKVSNLMLSWEGNESVEGYINISSNINVNESFDWIGYSKNTIDIVIKNRLYKNVFISNDGDGMFSIEDLNGTIITISYIKEGTSIDIESEENFKLTNLIIAESIDYLDFIDLSEIESKLENELIEVNKNINSNTQIINSVYNLLEDNYATIEYVNNKVLNSGGFDGWKSGSGIDSIMAKNAKEASGDYSHAEGNNTSAIGEYSHAEGFGSVSMGVGSHAEGTSTANGINSHAEGGNTVAQGICSHTEGLLTEALNISEHASGSKNISRLGINAPFGSIDNTLFTVGNGNPLLNGTNHNAFEIRQSGDIYISDVNAQGEYNEKPMINLQEKIKKLESNNGITEAIDNLTPFIINATYDVSTQTFIITDNFTEDDYKLIIQAAKINNIVLKCGGLKYSLVYAFTDYDNVISALQPLRLYFKNADAVSNNITATNNPIGSGMIKVQLLGITVTPTVEFIPDNFATKEYVDSKVSSGGTSDGVWIRGENGGAQMNKCTADGSKALAQGQLTGAAGDYSFASGHNSEAYGIASLAMGTTVGSLNDSEFACGLYNLPVQSSDNDATIFTVGNGISHEYKHNAFKIDKAGRIYIPDVHNADYQASSPSDYPMIELLLSILAPIIVPLDKFLLIHENGELTFQTVYNLPNSRYDFNPLTKLFIGLRDIVEASSKYNDDANNSDYVHVFERPLFISLTDKNVDNREMWIPFKLDGLLSQLNGSTLIAYKTPVIYLNNKDLYELSLILNDNHFENIFTVLVSATPFKSIDTKIQELKSELLQIINDKFSK